MDCMGIGKGLYVNREGTVWDTWVENSCEGRSMQGKYKRLSGEWLRFYGLNSLKEHIKSGWELTVKEELKNKTLRNSTS